jgi:hypothetical protein
MGVPFVIDIGGIFLILVKVGKVGVTMADIGERHSWQRGDYVYLVQ